MAPINNDQDITNITQKKEHEQLASFWDQKARALPWFSTWTKTLDWHEPYAHWFVDGTINASYVCLDAHLKTDRKDKIAIYWADEQGNKRSFTYQQLYDEVNIMAAVLQSLGVRKGDSVVLYLPMIPEIVIAMLAIARLGSMHVVVFSGLGDTALRDRINGVNASIVITADVGWRRGKKIELKRVLDQALQQAPSVRNVIVIEREQGGCCMQENRDLSFGTLKKSVASKTVAPVHVESKHPLFVLYTSGTTGTPKGVMHGTGGYLTYVYWTMQWAFNPQEHHVYWCTADIGWITGHSFGVYAPLMHGLSMVLYEGAIDYPDPVQWVNIIKDYNVSTFYTSPTAVRLFMKYGEALVKQGDLASLKVLGSVGEPLTPSVRDWYSTIIGSSRCPVIDTWWQTETGGFMVISQIDQSTGAYTMKPLPGVAIDIVDQHAHPVGSETKGYIVIKQPWPGMLIGIHNDRNNRLQNEYWGKFTGYYCAGDFAIKDEQGNYTFLGRSDDTLNVAGHRMGTAEIEHAALMHSAVAEAACFGTKDELKGEVIVVFVTIKKGFERIDALKQEILSTIRLHVGAFATPKEICFADSLPKTRSGKIMRRVIKAQYEGMPVGDITTLEE